MSGRFCLSETIWRNLSLVQLIISINFLHVLPLLRYTHGSKGGQSPHPPPHTHTLSQRNSIVVAELLAPGAIAPGGNRVYRAVTLSSQVSQNGGRKARGRFAPGVDMGRFRPPGRTPGSTRVFSSTHAPVTRYEHIGFNVSARRFPVAPNYLASPRECCTSYEGKRRAFRCIRRPLQIIADNGHSGG